MRTGVIGGFEDAIETGQSMVKQGVSDFANSAKGQIAGNPTSTPADQGTNEQGNAISSQMSDDQAKQFLKDLYGPTSKDGSKTDKPQSHPISEALGLPQSDPNVAKSPEEIAKLATLRNQLHQDYYQNLVNRPSLKEKPITEKLEEEKKLEELELTKKQEKAPGPLQNVKTGTAERVVGVSG